ncbi:hypothetical protein C8Q77DRAFT_241337 [Trametes polyzona]|nr:hypothetical protein C8Q77DRAFT_241337 [Trametes polyzona]
MASCFFERLNHDVLLLLIEAVRREEGLDNLSCTCKNIRSLCFPALFRYCGVNTGFFTSDHFIPRHVWSYVQHLTFGGTWADIIPKGAPTDDPSLLYLADVLPHMPNLRSVLILPETFPSLPEFALVMLLSLPILREFSLQDHVNYGAENAGHSTFPVAPLKVLRQVLPHYREHPRRCPDDVRLLVCLTSQRSIQESLEVLELPSEAIPSVQLAAGEWPRLRTVKFTGERVSRTPLLGRMLGRMPALEELELKVSSTPWARRATFFPPGWGGPAPWPQLRNLTISHPRHSDPLYSHLPTSLQRLSLRCWPRRYMFLLSHEIPVMCGLGWLPGVPKSSGMRKLLSQCAVLPKVEELELEYEEDDAECDKDMLNSIPHIFPNLVTLTVLRYRRPGNAVVPVEVIGKALAPLGHLQNLYLHLDFKGTPLPYSRMTEEYIAIEQETARILAQELSSSVKAICFLRRRTRYNIWSPYLVSRTGDGNFFALSCHAHPGDPPIRTSDESNPPYIPRFGMIISERRDR